MFNMFLVIVEHSAGAVIRRHDELMDLDHANVQVDVDSGK